MNTVSGDRESTPKSGNPGRLPRIYPQGRIGSGKNERLDGVFNGAKADGTLAN